MDYISAVFKASLWGEPLPKEPQWVQWMHREKGITHCETCIKLDKCWFLKEKTPENPQHYGCHCILMNLPYTIVSENATAICPYSKFNPYLFDTENSYKHGKQQMFISWGYSVEDSKYLQETVYRQGLSKYKAGEYELGKLDKNGQRIDIEIEIPRKDNGKPVKFMSGWMIRSDGVITLNTPYGGK